MFPSTCGTPMEPRNLNRHFEELRIKVEMPDVRLHDLRHTVVSLLLDLGTPPPWCRPSPVTRTST